MTMPQSSRVILPFPPKELNPNKRLHWSKLAKIKKAYKHDCYYLTKANIRHQYNPHSLLQVHLIFYPPDNRHRDDDNMESAFKAGRDGVSLALGVDDCFFRISKTISNENKNCVEVRIEG